MFVPALMFASPGIDAVSIRPAARSALRPSSRWPSSLPRSSSYPLTWLPRPVAYGASGGEAWADHYDGPVDNYSIAFDVAISRDSRKAIVTGGSWAPTKGYDFATIAYGVTNGPRLWVRRYDGPDSLSDVAYSVAISPNGSTAFVVGKSDSDVHLDDYLTIAYSLK